MAAAIYTNQSSPSIDNLVCLCSECLTWDKQQSAPRVAEDHCVNGPRTAHSSMTLFKYRHQLLNTSTQALGNRLTPQAKGN